MFVLALQTTHPVFTGKLAAVLAIALVGIILVSASAIGSEGHCGCKEVKSKGNNSIVITLPPTKQTFCTPLSALELAKSLLALIGGSFMWSVSSSKLFIL